MGGKDKFPKGKQTPEKEGSRRKLSLKKIPWALVRIYLLFGAVLVFFFFLLDSDFFYKEAMEPFTAFLAVVSSKILNVFGAGTYVSGTNLSSPDFGINIVYGCNGAYATAILLSGIIAYPSRMREKLMGVIIGIPAIFIINQLRVISLFLLGRKYPSVFEEVHVYVWQPIIIIFAILVWDFWARNFIKKDKIKKCPVCN
jgi:exosortase H (IPTLxxWG-CTERM-specific)